ncbi:MAG: DUF2200 domain-containing protein [Thermoplasmatota archaeon]
MNDATRDRVFAISFGGLYPVYVNKVKRKGRTAKELDEVLRWLTGYTKKGLESQMAEGTDLAAFFAKAPKMNPARSLIKGVVCGVRVEEIKDPTMQAIRYMDKLVDELARGKKMASILRTQ